MTAYPKAGNGSIAPIAITPDMIFPAGIARDGSGRIYVTNTSTNTVTIYSPDAAGNVSPLAVIGGSETRLSNPTGIALDANGKIYVLNSGTSAISVYLPLGASTGFLNQAPLAAIAGSKTMLALPVAIAVDGNGDIYIANQLGGPVAASQGLTLGLITVYAAGSNGNVTPSATISGIATGLIEPVSIALDSNRNVYVANLFTSVEDLFVFQPNISVYPAGSEGDAQPIAVIT